MHTCMASPCLLLLLCASRRPRRLPRPHAAAGGFQLQRLRQRQRDGVAHVRRPRHQGRTGPPAVCGRQPRPGELAVLHVVQCSVAQQSHWPPCSMQDVAAHARLQQDASCRHAGDGPGGSSLLGGGRPNLGPALHHHLHVPLCAPMLQSLWPSQMVGLPAIKCAMTLPSPPPPLHLPALTTTTTTEPVEALCQHCACMHGTACTRLHACSAHQRIWLRLYFALGAPIYCAASVAHGVCLHAGLNADLFCSVPGKI